MDGWALDLGTTNTGISYWNRSSSTAHMLKLPLICRQPGAQDSVDAPRLVPSSTHLLPIHGLWQRIGQSKLALKHAFWGQTAEIGRRALALNEGWVHSEFAPTFKQFLGRAPHRTLAHLDGQAISARLVAQHFFRELLRQVKKETNERIRDLVVTVPVESYDQYRAEIAGLASRVGVQRVRFLDEPVAAAIGYGLGIKNQRKVLVVDFGGGTLDLAVVELSPRKIEVGDCRVLAKSGRPIGGNVIDEWLLEAFAKVMKLDLHPKADFGHEALWHRLLLDEARRVKEAVYFNETATFSLSPPAELRQIKSRIGRDACYCDTSREQVVEYLTDFGLYDILTDCADELGHQLTATGLSEDDLDDVLMVGGSTLLPQVFNLFEQRYGRARVRAWQPFEAVAYGAAAYAAGEFGQSDFLVHDYAMVTYNATSHAKEFITIIGHGTRFPTKFDHWKRQLVPTCALGEPESVFKLVVAEISGRGRERKFAWDESGRLHRVGEDTGADPLVVPLNESNPTLGRLDPPHAPGDQTPRLEVAFGVDQNRWLIATVRDLRSGRTLMRQKPVVRVL
ncbi:MAG: Hsp70 family protein [Myxococcota bacterium]|nr:Hsp70 family protein [Myxococcota bacterium]